jgi:hypothetical protein
MLAKHGQGLKFNPQYHKKPKNPPPQIPMWKAIMKDTSTPAELVVLGFELKGSHLLGRHSYHLSNSTNSILQCFFFFFKLFARVGFKPQFS